MLGRRVRAGFAALAAAAGLLAWSPPTGASDGGTSFAVAPSNGYVNPFKPSRWYAGRTDMGVDYVPQRRHRVVAIGDAKIMGSDSHSDWPGGHFIYYKLLSGDHAGNFVYVAERLRRLRPAGTRVAAGQRIAIARAGGTGLETGWATRSGQPRAGTCYSEGMKTHSGREMAKFLKHLGAEVGDPPGTVPDYPSGRRC